MIISMIMFAALRNEEIADGDVAYYVMFVTGIAIIPPIFSFYTHYYFLFSRFLQKQKVLLSILGSILLSAMAVTLGLIFINLTNEVAAGCVEQGFPYSFGFTFGLSLLYGIIGLVLKGFLTWYEELKVKEELLERTHKMELALVKSQLDPHFLFNTINNIDILITKDPEEASVYLKKLSDMMRFMLYQTKGEEIPLSKELDYIEKYIELQKIRTSNQNYVHYEVNGESRQKKVAPMIFIPFIENAFKHASNKKVNEAVNIGIQIKEEAIIFKCQNRFQKHKTTKNGDNGLGNDLIQKRLHLLYPNKHSLKVSKLEDQYSVELTLMNGTV
jgi:hypothetical protein